MLYFFDIVDDGPLPDHQGLELPDLEAAQAHALQIALTYLRQDPRQMWHTHEWSLEIRQSDGASLYRLSFQIESCKTTLPHPEGVFSDVKT